MTFRHNVCISSPPPTEVAAVMAARLVWAVMLATSGFELAGSRGRGGVMHWIRGEEGRRVYHLYSTRSIGPCDPSIRTKGP